MGNEVKAVYLRDGYSRSSALDGWYRPVTVGEVKSGRYGDLYATDRSGCVRNVRENGRVRTWKRSPGCALPCKYGLRDCFTVDCRDRQDHEPMTDGRITLYVAVRHEFTQDTPAGIVTDYVTDHEIGTHQ